MHAFDLHSSFLGFEQQLLSKSTYLILSELIELNMTDCDYDSNLPWQIFLLSLFFYIWGIFVSMIRSTIARKKQAAADHEIALSQQQNSIDDMTYSSGTQIAVQIEGGISTNQIEEESKEDAGINDNAITSKEGPSTSFKPSETIIITEHVSNDNQQSNGDEWSNGIELSDESKEEGHNDKNGCCCIMAVRKWAKWMKNIGPDTWSMMKIYTSPTLHIMDTITDYSTLGAFYLAAQNTTPDDCG